MYFDVPPNSNFNKCGKSPLQLVPKCGNYLFHIPILPPIQQNYVDLKFNHSMMDIY
jgi:hypothetical protein